jgi:hypothetical protein
VAGVGVPGRRTGAGREGDGDGERAVAEGPVDAPAIARGHLDGGAVEAPGDEAPVLRAPRPDSEPAGVVEEGVGDVRAASRWCALPRGRISTRRIFANWMLTPREQGDVGELSAMCWLASRGAHVAVPVGSSPHWDLMAELDGRAIRVQVKTSRCFVKGRWDVTLCTRGGNQSWNGLVKRLDATRYDFLFVLVADGRRWFIPASRVAAAPACVWVDRSTRTSRSSAVSRSRRARRQRPPTIERLDPRGDVRVAKGGGL